MVKTVTAKRPVMGEHGCVEVLSLLKGEWCSLVGVVNASGLEFCDQLVRYAR